MTKVIDSAWNIKKEGHLNPNNIIFKMKKVNDKIKEKR